MKKWTHHNLWHAVHGNIQCVETIQTIVRSKLEQCKLNDLADGHEYTRFNNENDDESVAAHRGAKIFGIQGSCNIPPKSYSWGLGERVSIKPTYQILPAVRPVTRIFVIIEIDSILWAHWTLADT